MEKIKITVERAEVRNGKIIVCFRPDLLSGQTFAVNPFYDEGDLKNQLQQAHFVLSLTEDHGEIKNLKVDYTGVNTHYTKGHTQIHYPMTSFTFDRRDAAIIWFTEKITPDSEYWKDHVETANKHWSKVDPDFLPRLNETIKEQERQFYFKQVKQAKYELHQALDKLDKLMLTDK